MRGALRGVTIVLALVYLGASAYHSGLIIPAGALTPASVAEALLGLVLIMTIFGFLGPRLGYGVVLLGILFGLTIRTA